MLENVPLYDLLTERFDIPVALDKRTVFGSNAGIIGAASLIL